MSRAHVRLSPSAHFTAQAWVREGFPNAELFDTLAGRVLFGSSHWVLSVLGRRAPSLPWHEQFLFIRHHALEARLEALAPTYVLEAGAGLSPRGLTFARRFPHLTYVEVDLPHMVRRKRRCLKGRGAPSNYHLVEGDLTDPRLLDGLPALPKPSDSVVIVTEGVLDYLSMRDKRCAMATFVSLLSSVHRGSHLFDAYTLDRLAKYPLSSAAVLGFASAVGGTRFKSRLFRDVRELEELARSAGYTEFTRLDVERLNSSRYHPPMSHCHFELIEAGVTPSAHG
jgi:O-methyltransferase involved in polyketide biosynthesis